MRLAAGRQPRAAVALASACAMFAVCGALEDGRTSDVAAHAGVVPAVLAATGQRLLRRGARPREVEERPRGLDASQLAEIRTVSCLKARQLDPQFACKGDEEVTEAMLEALAKRSYSDVPLGLGNFPSWRNAACHSGGRLLCDPAGFLEDDGAWNKVAAAMDGLGARASVTCGALESKMALEDLHEQKPFHLAVVVASGAGFPRLDTDARTMQKFGLFVLANWELMPTYNGIRVSTSIPPAMKRALPAHCPDAALLVVLPEYGEAFLSAASCEFLCAERGGSQVVAAVEGALVEGKPLADAIVAGVQAVGDVLNTTSSAPLSMVEPALTRKWRAVREHRTWMDRLRRSDGFWLWAQRVVFVGLMLFAAFILVAFAYYNCGPQSLILRKGRQ